MMKYGYFDDEAREYVITTPETPLPWINYLGMEAMFGICSQTGGGYSWYKDAKLLRITRYRYNNIPADQDGRIFYLKEDEDVWSPAFRPVNAPVEDFKCRHGQGYTIISSRHNGIRSELRFFVPLKENAEIRELTVTNASDRIRTLKAFSFTEFCLWNAADDDRNYQRLLSCGEVEVEPGVIYHKTEYRERRNHYAFLASSEVPASFDTDRDVFLGGAYGTLAMPAAVKNGKCSDSIAHGWYPCAAQQFEFTLQPGESKRISFVLGYVEVSADKKFTSLDVINKEPARALMARFDTPEKIDSAFAALCAKWDELLNIFTIKSMDEKFQRMVNIWHPYQTMCTFNFSRSTSLFEVGVGRGMGFRDSNQDLLGFVHLDPVRARERILDLAATQKPDGGAYHQYQPLTKQGNSEIGGNFNDDPMWLILSVCAYIRETGDVSILDETVDYDNKKELAQPLLDHLFRSHNHCMNKRGPHKLPCIGRADWNDCLNLNCFSTEPGESFQTFGTGEGTVAESLMIAGLFVFAARNFAGLLDFLGKKSDADKVRSDMDEMIEAVKKSGRDPEWYIRAYDASGRKLGSNMCEDGKIFIESNAWCTMAQIGKDDGFDLQALDAVEKHLGTEHGLLLQHPAYKTYNSDWGEMTSYPRGVKENGAIFCHCNPWVIIAEALYGQKDRAFDHYSRIAPAWREEISEIHRCEPYVYAQMIAGKESPRFGEAKNSWLTGTAAWNYLAASGYLLGIRADYTGLVIDPQLPDRLLPVTVSRTFRGCRYNITIRKGNAKRLTVNGKEVPYCTPAAPEAVGEINAVCEI